MILIINVCRERLHYFEFVKPVEDILKGFGLEFESYHYKQLNDSILTRVDKMIICGTSLRDDEFLKDLDRFKDTFSYFDLHSKKVDVLGICAGFQILGLVFGGELKKNTEIGFFREKFSEKFLGLSGEVEVYHLHNNYVEFGEEWERFSGVDFAQAVKWKNFYGVLFHPEVRNKKMILEFCGI